MVENITNQVHNAGATVQIGTNITVTADYTGAEDGTAEMNGKYFVMTNAVGVLTGIITTSTVHTGDDFTITVHAPEAVSRDCAVDVTITIADQQTDPQVLIKDMIEDNMEIIGWTTIVNDKWWEAGKRYERQVFFDDRRDHYVEHEEIYLPRGSLSNRKIHHVFVGVAGGDSKVPGVSKAQRWDIECEMRRIFSDSALCIDPIDDVGIVYIEDAGMSVIESNKNKKVGCEEFYATFEIFVVYWR